jgi:hypothetical protein
MIGAGTAALVAGLFLLRARFTAASGVSKILLLGPVFEAVALAIFAAEHFLAARDLSAIVPRWMPGPLFWTYFVGAALLAAAISFNVPDSMAVFGTLLICTGGILSIMAGHSEGRGHAFGNGHWQSRWKLLGPKSKS